MTRINLVPPQELCDQHLLAEWRELPRMAGLATHTKRILIPTTYRLGTGHMLFFLDKGMFLEHRHRQLTAELKRRGFKLQPRTPFRMPTVFGYENYRPTPEALQLNRQRIADRMPRRPRWSSTI